MFHCDLACFFSQVFDLEKKRNLNVDWPIADFTLGK